MGVFDPVDWEVAEGVKEAMESRQGQYSKHPVLMRNSG